jgi:mediator of RNA polymerase II transcription subunit 17
MTHGYELIIRTQLMIQISEKNLKVISKDGKVVTISHEPQELRDFLLSQISLHQVK